MRTGFLKPDDMPEKIARRIESFASINAFAKLNGGLTDLTDKNRRFFGLPCNDNPYENRRNTSLFKTLYFPTGDNDDIIVSQYETFVS